MTFGKTKVGTFVEVGGFDGYSYSNTWGLAQLGWRGILVEPVPEFAARCRETHSRNPHVQVIEKAASDLQGQLTLSVAGPLTTGNHELHEEYEGLRWAAKDLTHKSITVSADRLDSILVNAGFKGRLDVLVVDVEGGEEKVMSGFDVNRWTPTMLIIELTDTHPDLQATRESDRRLSKSIIRHGYEVIYKDSINTVFVRLDRPLDATPDVAFGGSASAHPNSIDLI